MRILDVDYFVRLRGNQGKCRPRPRYNSLNLCLDTPGRRPDVIFLKELVHLRPVVVDLPIVL
jgi:hypothetical protein